MTPSTYLYAQKCRFFHGFCTFFVILHGIVENKGFLIPLWSRNQFRKQIILSF